MMELTTAGNLSMISINPPPRRHKLIGKYKDCWAVSYSANGRIVFKPTGEYNIEDLTTITEITIIYVGDYH